MHGASELTRSGASPAGASGYCIRALGLHSLLLLLLLPSHSRSWMPHWALEKSRRVEASRVFGDGIDPRAWGRGWCGCRVATLRRWPDVDWLLGAPRSAYMGGPGGTDYRRAAAMPWPHRRVTSRSPACIMANHGSAQGTATSPIRELLSPSHNEMCARCGFSHSALRCICSNSGVNQ